MNTRFSIPLACALVCPAAWAGKSAPNTPNVVSGGVAVSRGYLTAGPEGATYRTSTGYEVQLSPTTCIRFAQSTKLQLTISASTPTQVLELRAGRVDVRSPKQPSGPQALMVTSPNKVMGVFTTGDGIVMAASRSLTVASERGEMLVGVDNDWRPLPAGYARTFDTEDRAGKARPIVGAPVVHLVSTLVLDTGAEASPTRATWAPLPNAVRYDVSIVADGGASKHLATTEPRVELPVLEPGTYTLIARAFDRQDLPGPASQTRQVRVVRPILPPGAYVGRDGAIRLETHDRVRLAGAEGLWMTHGPGDQFVRVPESVGLFRGTTVQIRIRDSQSPAEIPLDLVPQLDHASIMFEPLRPRWPDQAVTVGVELYDGHGQPTAESVSATVDVSVNQRRLSTQWKRQGNRMIASVRPPSPLGPWSLKVRVARPSGELVAGSVLLVEER